MFLFILTVYFHLWCFYKTEFIKSAKRRFRFNSDIAIFAHGGSLEITLTVPLIEKSWSFVYILANSLSFRGFATEMKDKSL